MKHLNSLVIESDKPIAEAYLSFVIASSNSISTLPNHLRVNERPITSNWRIHFSVVQKEIETLLPLVCPKLVEQNKHFDLIKNEESAADNLHGRHGYFNIGKIITIYPSTTEDALSIINDFYESTSALKGPEINNAVQLGSIIYVTYEKFNSIKERFESASLLNIKQSRNGENQVVLRFPNEKEETVVWPFPILKYSLPTQNKLILNKYYSFETIRKDAKGSIRKALFFESFVKIKKCVIKEGKQNMYFDNYGRDIRERLHWQVQVQKELSLSVPTPKIYGCVDEQNKTYLILENINGTPLNIFLSAVHNKKKWYELELRFKQILLEYSLKLVSIIEAIHKKGIIHRDLSPGNFIITQRGDLYLLDFELSYSLNRAQPKFPFGLGTFGFMSPEQEAESIPTEKEDIYALGGLLLLIFIDISPHKFNVRERIDFFDNLIFFTGDTRISNLIVDCQSIDPVSRPSLMEIKETLELLLKSYSENTNVSVLVNYKRKEKGEQTIQMAINGLQNLLLSSFAYHNESEYYDKFGLYNGLAGVMLILSRAKKAGYSIEYSESYFFERRTLLQEVCNPQSPFKEKFGMLNGIGGMIYGFTEALESELIDSSTISALLMRAISGVPEKLNIAQGFSGQCFGLLKALDSNKITGQQKISIDRFLANHVNLLIDTLNNPTRDAKHPMHKITHLSFAGGHAGIVYAALKYFQFKKDQVFEHHIKSALNRLVKNPSITKGKTIDISFNYGHIGIALTFLTAYETLGNETYKKYAVQILDKELPNLLFQDTGLSAGVVGVAEVYLKAYKIFKDQHWLEKIAWFVDALQHSFYKLSISSGYWVVDARHKPNPSLFEGYPGIINFLIKFHQLTNA